VGRKGEKRSPSLSVENKEGRYEARSPKKGKGGGQERHESLCAVRKKKRPVPLEGGGVPSEFAVTEPWKGGGEKGIELPFKVGQKKEEETESSAEKKSCA